MTLLLIPSLLNYVNNFRVDRKIGHFFSTTVMTHNFLHPEIFGANFFDNDFIEILNNMPEITWQQKEAKKYMLGIQSQLNSVSRDQQKINQLGTFLNEIDRRRNLNWKETFPWLMQELTDVV